MDPAKTPSGFELKTLALGIALGLVIIPLTVYRFTIEGVPDWLSSFPVDPDIYSSSARWLEGVIDDDARGGASAFDGIVLLVRQVLDAISLALIGTPWIAVMAVIVVIALRCAGPRVAIFMAAAFAYIAFLGYWEIAMETVALGGAAVVLCVVMGIPLGIWFGKAKRAYGFAELVLDLTQTPPAFVYLIPIIAVFGTGNPPGILATIILGMPPLIHLTTLGMRSVPDSIKRAAGAALDHDGGESPLLAPPCHPIWRSVPHGYHLPREGRAGVGRIVTLPRRSRAKASPTRSFTRWALRAPTRCSTCGACRKWHPWRRGALGGSTPVRGGGEANAIPGDRHRHAHRTEGADGAREHLRRAGRGCAGAGGNHHGLYPRHNRPTAQAERPNQPT
ncbi:MAG: ABC transporter permease [Shimia sp.]